MRSSLAIRPGGARAALASTGILLLVAGCTPPPPPPPPAGTAGPTASASSSPATPAPTAPPGRATAGVSTGVGQTCTDGWRAHGHTTQAEAKAFAERCLRDQGVVPQQLTRDQVMALASSVVTKDNPLTGMVPSDIAAFCPGYAAQAPAARARFWATLLTAIARPESNFRTTTTFWEGGSLNQFSIGLLQLSYTDRSYGCDFRNEADIADPVRNLSCGARIVEKWVAQDNAIGGNPLNNGAARYWSTLRSSSSARAEIIAATSSLAMCR